MTTFIRLTLRERGPFQRSLQPSMAGEHTFFPLGIDNLVTQNTFENLDLYIYRVRGVLPPVF
jgi:hypothetical protein